MTSDKRFVYVLENADAVARFYSGLTSDPRRRLDDHNAGRCPHTARHRPYVPVVVSGATIRSTFESLLLELGEAPLAKRDHGPVLAA